MVRRRLRWWAGQLGRTVFVAEVGNFLAVGVKDEQLSRRELLTVGQVDQSRLPVVPGRACSASLADGAAVQRDYGCVVEADSGPAVPENSGRGTGDCGPAGS